MASPLRLTIAAPAPPERVDAAWAAVRAEFEAVEVAMSRFHEDSEITCLHRSRRSGRQPSRRLVAALAAADRARRVTDGRFDVRVVRDLERLGAGGVPQSWPRAAGRDEPGRFLRRDARRGPIELLAPVDLGGIGKGLALRWAARRARAFLGEVRFLIEAGGDIVSHGSPGAEPWSIGIEDPADGPEPIATCSLFAGEAIATSSVRIGRWQDPDGRPVHHLIDPRTGEPGGAGLAAVTVAWADPAWAEVWSKALFLDGPAAIGEGARRRGLAAWWVDGSGELSMTPAARLRTTWVRAEAISRR
jgi:thiamine biosynthesis lipoprotein